MSEPYEALVRRLRAAGCVFAEDEAQLLLAETGDASRLEGLVSRRVAGEPLEQVLGWVEFAGVRLTVQPGVFVPRRRTEALARTVSAAAAIITTHRPLVVDLCCGVGALASVVASTVPHAELYAADVLPAAVACTRINVPSASVHQGDLYGALPAALRGRVDVLGANAPYVPTGAIATLPPEARDHEPRRTFDGGPDGLDVLRRVLAGAPGWLAPGGVVLVESHEDQAPALLDAARAAGLDAAAEVHDGFGTAVVRGRSGASLRG